MHKQTYLVNKARKQRFRLNGIVPIDHLPDNEQLCGTFRDHQVINADQLPPKVDLRPDMTPVEDQSQINSCTANALAGAYEYLTKKASGQHVDFSRLFIYYNARARRHGGDMVQDTGCSMTDAIAALRELGVCKESVWSYDASRKNARPDQEAFQQAEDFQIQDALQVGINLEEMKSCLAQGLPFAFGLRLFTTFDKAGKSGIVPMPDAWAAGRQSHGSHALLAVGYSDESQAFIVRNSWGEQWGDRGYCYIPYGYIANPEFCFDAWSIRKVENDDLGHENWKYDDAVNYRVEPEKETTDPVDEATNENGDDENGGDDDDDDNVDIAEVEEDDDEDEESKNVTFWSDVKFVRHAGGYSYSRTTVRRGKNSSHVSHHSSHHHSSHHFERHGFGDDDDAFKEFNKNDFGFRGRHFRGFSDD